METLSISRPQDKAPQDEARDAVALTSPTAEPSQQELMRDTGVVRKLGEPCWEVARQMHASRIAA
jgi:hypothetical protein